MLEVLIRNHTGVRQLIAMTRPEVVCLQETKIANMTAWILLSTLGQDFDQHIARPVEGTQGGILIAWKSSSCVVVDMRSDTNSTGMVTYEGIWLATRCPQTFIPPRVA